MRIVFWGTPDFAVPSLRALQEEGHAVAAVVTQPDRPAGRGRAPRASPVKREAEAEGIPVLQPERARDAAFLDELRRFAPDLSVVAAYGQILTREAIDLPARGTVNVHASLLPELRGAAPVNWAIIRGHTHSGVTIMRIVEELDAGPILYRVAAPLSDDITAGELHDMLAEIGATALVETLAQLEAGTLREMEQNHDRATYAPKLDRQTCRLDWSRPAAELARWVRGCDPRPGAWSELRGEPVQLFGPFADPADGPPAPPGTVLAADPRRGLRLATGEGSLWIDEVRPAGRRRMAAPSWIAGRGIAEGDRLT
ncbi:MAG: methionyl-tRNA formyltransferase [Gemmatimonadota bacterium]|nr:methionyl-tRNA formyltransferase [Gemmatimonadota bacterium]